jgi:hypothetical protein
MQPSPAHLTQETAEFYRRAMRGLEGAGVAYLVGGAYAFARYTGIERHTKDFDIFCLRQDAPRVLEVLGGLGCRTELTFPHWLNKAYAPEGDDFIDVIYSSGSGIAVVDEAWFTHSVPSAVLDVPTRLCPAEEIVWSKAFIMERERFDGADIAHIIRARGSQMDWNRLLARFGRHWRVLFSHLVLFGFIYPGDTAAVPREVEEELLGRLQAEARAPSSGKLCQGTLLSRAQYLVDIGAWGYRDARLDLGIQMTAADIAHWTNAIEVEAEKDGQPRTAKGDAPARRGR